MVKHLHLLWIVPSIVLSHYAWSYVYDWSSDDIAIRASSVVIGFLLGWIARSTCFWGGPHARRAAGKLEGGWW